MSFILTGVVVQALLGASFKGPSVDYDRYKLHELVACADLIVTGTVTNIDSRTYDLAACSPTARTERLAAKAMPGTSDNIMIREGEV